MSRLFRPLSIGCCPITLRFLITTLSIFSIAVHDAFSDSLLADGYFPYPCATPLLPIEGPLSCVSWKHEKPLNYLG
jgi:hypothetical protein